MAGFLSSGRITGRPWLAVLGLVLVLAACASAPVPVQPHDPFEATNRAWFDRNLAATQAITGAASRGGEIAEIEAAPRHEDGGALRRMVRNFGANLSIPGTVANDLLQLRPDRAVENTLRFAFNSTIGIGGLFDPATPAGLPGRASDFGETLHRWGVGEGAYVVLPVLGPSTERDAVGIAVDALIDPWGFAVSAREARAVSAGRWAGRIAAASENADLLDANVIQTADPYAQARLLFLQMRRYHLGIETEDDVFDPYDFLD